MVAKKYSTSFKGPILHPQMRERTALHTNNQQHNRAKKSDPQFRAPLCSGIKESAEPRNTRKRLCRRQLKVCRKTRQQQSLARSEMATVSDNKARMVERLETAQCTIQAMIFATVFWRYCNSLNGSNVMWMGKANLNFSCLIVDSMARKVQWFGSLKNIPDKLCITCRHD